jgi:hypothetical protein
MMLPRYISTKTLGQVTLAGIALLVLVTQFTSTSEASEHHLIESAQGCYYGSYSTYIAGDC